MIDTFKMKQHVLTSYQLVLPLSPVFLRGHAVELLVLDVKLQPVIWVHRLSVHSEQRQLHVAGAAVLGVVERVLCTSHTNLVNIS